MKEFQTPVEETRANDNRKTVFKPLDQTLITAVMLILIGLLTWMAYTTQTLSVSMAELNAKFEAAESKRDLSLLYIDRRLENLEIQVKQDEESKRR